MKIALTLLLLFTTQIIAVSFIDLVQEEWESFKLKYNKQYDNEIEERLRRKIYIKNAYNVVKHNQKYEMGLVSYNLKLNQFSDMLHDEFVQTMNGFKKSYDSVSRQIQKKGTAPTFILPANVELPDHVDWRDAGAVTPVKNQGQCGSCWSFSTTGSLEGQHFRKYGQLVSLSEQNLIDCTSYYGNNGCGGGLMDNAFVYVRDNHGIDTENTYPYEAVDDVCKYNPQNSGADDKGYMIIQEGNEEALKAAVATVGPIAIAIDASQNDFQFYSNGVYYNMNCNSANLDHAVLVVGYGTTNDGKDYWLVKNSWGTNWGDNGYIKMARNENNNCGIASEASYPLV